MAERYGTIPKRFTAKWWEYIWNYYKWWIIVPIALIIIISGFIYYIMKLNQIDIILTYAGPRYFHGGEVKAIQTEYSKDCADVNKDGKKMLSFSNLTISDSDTDMEYKSSVVTSLQFALYEEEKYIFIIHKDFAPRFFQSEKRKCAYAPVSDWLTADIQDKGMLSAHGLDYGVSLEGSKIFEKWGADMKDHYLFIGRCPSDKKELRAYNAAIKLANKLLEK